VFTRLIAGNPLERFFSLTGLALNALFLLNIVASFVPPGFLNPSWELQTINNAISFAPLLLVGTAMSGAGLYMQEKPQKLGRLQIFCTVMVVFFGISIPLYVFDSIRLYSDTTEKIDQQLGKLTDEIDRQSSRLEELAKSGGLPANFDPSQARGRIDTARAESQKEASATRKQAQIGLARLAFTRIGSLLILVVLLFSLGQLSKFIARGIVLDPDVKN
jgi:ElaB/YqjD/DUF883 family membrane-anchored ribosome-binding protein